MKPVDYGLSTEALTEVAERNLKVLSTIMLFLIRRVSTPREAPMMVGMASPRVVVVVVCFCFRFLGFCAFFLMIKMCVDNKNGLH